MRFSNINEGIEQGDLQSLVKNIVSVAEFEPKTGTENEVVVIGFYCDDEAPANDLAKFIERSAAEILDTEVSPNPDDEGFYMVFVEVNNTDELIKTVFEVLIDAARLTNIDAWEISFYSGNTIKIGNDEIKKWLKKN